MIRHVVLFSAIDPADIDTIVETLSGYRDIPGVRTLEVERSLKRDRWSSEIDVMLHATFDDEAALAAYKRHPIYEAGTRTVRPLRNLRFVADTIVPDHPLPDQTLPDRAPVEALGMAKRALEDA